MSVKCIITICLIIPLQCSSFDKGTVPSADFHSYQTAEHNFGDHAIEVGECLKLDKKEVNVLDADICAINTSSSIIFQRLKPLVKTILEIVQYKLKNNPVLLQYAKGESEIEELSFHQVGNISSSLIVLSKEMKVVLQDEYYDGHRESIRLSSLLPEKMLWKALRIIRDHNFADELMKHDLTPSDLPIWAFYMFMSRESSSINGQSLSEAVPSLVIEFLRQKVHESNIKESDPSCSELSWDDLPLWILPLTKYALSQTSAYYSKRKEYGFQESLMLKHFLKWVLTFYEFDFKENESSITSKLDQVPQWLMDLIRKVLKRCEGSASLQDIKMSINELLDYVIHEVRKKKLECKVKAKTLMDNEEHDSYPTWLVDVVEEMINTADLSVKPDHEGLATKLFFKSQELHQRGLNVTEKVMYEPSPYMVNWINDGVMNVVPVDNHWLVRLIKARLEELGWTLKYDEIPDWMVDILISKYETSGYNVSFLQSNIAVDEMLDFAVSLTMYDIITPAIIKDRISMNEVPSWALLFLKNILETSDALRNISTSLIKLDNLLCWSLEIAVKDKEGILESVEVDKFPDLVIAYISEKFERKHFPPWSPLYVLESPKNIEKEPDAHGSLRGLPAWIKNYISMRLRAFNKGHLKGNVPALPDELPAWFVDLIQTKVQRHYDKKLLCPPCTADEMTPFWMVELIKMKMFQNSFVSSIMDHYITLKQIVDYAILSVNNKYEKDTKVSLAFENIPDWLIYFFRTHVDWHNEGKEVMERYLSLNQLLDWSVMHNIRRKWGTKGEKTLMFKDNLRELPKWAVLFLKTKLNEYNKKAPPIAMQFFPLTHWEKQYLESNMQEFYPEGMGNSTNLIPASLPYWALELLHFTLANNVEENAVTKASWTFSDIMRWTIWNVKIKSFNVNLGSDLELTDIPDWVISILKSIIGNSGHEIYLTDFQISTKEILEWGIRNNGMATDNLDSNGRSNVISDWLMPYFQLMIKGVNNGTVKCESFKMPINQLPVWSLEIMEHELEAQGGIDLRKVNFGVIELLQSMLQEFNAQEEVMDIKITLEEVVTRTLCLGRKRKSLTEVNAQLEINEIPEWIINFCSDLMNQYTNLEIFFRRNISLNEIIHWSIRNYNKKINEMNNSGKMIKGVPLWLIDEIVLKLQEDYSYKFPSEYEELPTWVTNLIRLKVDERWKKLGVESVKMLDVVPNWLNTFLQIKNLEKNHRKSLMNMLVSLNEILEYSIWKIKSKEFFSFNSFVTFLDLPDWMWHFLEIKVSKNLNDKMILQHEMSLIEFIDMGIGVASNDGIKNLMPGMTSWAIEFIERKIDLINDGKIHFVKTESELSQTLVNKLITVVKKSYGDMAIGEDISVADTIPYWIMELLKCKTNESNSNIYAMAHHIKMEEIVEFGLWITNLLNNNGGQKNTQKFRLVNVPLWLIELITAKVEVLPKEKEILNYDISLDELLSFAINSSITRKTYKTNDQWKSSLALCTIPRNIKDFLMLRVSSFNESGASRKFQAPSNQLPFWAMKRIEEIVQNKYRGMWRNGDFLVWSALPFWIAQLLQSMIQQHNGSPSAMDIKINRNDIVDWTIFVINESKNAAGIKTHVKVTELPQWLAEFLRGGITNDAIHISSAETGTKLEGILSWAIGLDMTDSFTEDDDLNGDVMKNVMKDVPKEFVLLIYEVIKKTNRAKGNIKFSAKDIRLPKLITEVIEKVVKDAVTDESLESDLQSIMQWELSQSWVAEFAKEISKRLSSDIEVIEYTTNMAEIMAFGVWYSYNLINDGGNQFRRDVGFLDLPEWLIEFIKSVSRLTKDVKTAIHQKARIIDLLKWSMNEGIVVQTIQLKTRALVRPESSLQSSSLQEDIMSLIQQEINSFDEMKNTGSFTAKVRQRKMNHLTISVKRDIQDMVIQKYQQIVGKETEMAWTHVPYWVVKLIQALYDYKESRNIMSYKLSFRDLVHWLIRWEKMEREILNVEVNIMWYDMPKCVFDLMSDRKLGGRHEAVMTEYISVQEIINAAVVRNIRERESQKDLLLAGTELLGIPEKIIEVILETIGYANENTLLQSMSTELPPWAIGMIEKAVEEYCTHYSLNNFKPFIKWEIMGSWIIDLFYSLINKLGSEVNVTTYTLTTREIITFAVTDMQNKIRLNSLLDITELRLIDLPEWLVLFLKNVIKENQDLDSALERGQTIDGLLRWTLQNSITIQTLIGDDLMIPNLDSNINTTVILPQWVKDMFAAEIDYYYYGLQSRNQFQEMNTIQIFTVIDIKKRVSRKLNDMEDISVIGEECKMVPYNLIKFIQGMLSRKYDRDIMTNLVTKRDIIHWTVGFLENIFKAYEMEREVTVSDLPRNIVTFITEVKNDVDNHEKIMETLVRIGSLVNYGIRNEIRKYVDEVDQNNFKTEYPDIPSQIVNAFINSIREDEIKEKFNLTDHTELPEWAFRLLEIGHPSIHHLTHEERHFYAEEIVPSWIKGYLQQSVNGLQTVERLMSYPTSASEIFKFAIRYSKTIYNLDDMHQNHFFRLFDMPVWLVEFVRELAKELICNTPDNILKHPISIPKLLEYSMSSSIAMATIKREDIVMTNLKSKDNLIPECIKEFLQMKVANYSANTKHFIYKKTGNELPIWMINKIKSIIKQKFKETAKYVNSEVGLHQVPYWLAEYIQTHLENNKGSKLTLDSKTTIDEFVNWIIARVKYTKDKLKLGGEIEWTDLPDWLIIFLQMEIGGVEKSMLGEKSMNIGYIINWGIMDSISMVLYYNDIYNFYRDVIHPLSPLLWFIKKEIDILNSNQQLQSYNISKIKIPKFLNERINEVLRKHYGNSSTSCYLDARKMTPKWLIGLLKIKLQQYGEHESILNESVTMKELVEYALWLTKHTNYIDSTISERKIRFLDLPDWLTTLDIMKYMIHSSSSISLNSLLDTVISKSKWSKYNSILIRDEKPKKMFGRKIPNWLPNFLQSKVHFNRKDNLMIKASRKLMNHLPIWAVIHLRKKIKVSYEEWQEKVPDNIWAPMPFWMTQLIQSKVQEYNGSRNALMHHLTADELAEWAIWMMGGKEKGMKTKGCISMYKVPEQIGEIIVMNYTKGTDAGRSFLEDVIRWSLDLNVAEKTEYEDLSFLARTLHKIPIWAIKKIHFAMVDHNNGRIPYSYNFPVNEMPHAISDRFVMIIQKIYSENLDFSLAKTEGLIPYWIEVFVKFKYSIQNEIIHKMDYDFLNKEVTVKEIMHFAMWVTQKIKDEDKDLTRHKIRWIDLPHWFLEFIKTMATSEMNEKSFMKKSLKIDKLMVWSVNNSIRRTVCSEDESLKDESISPEYLSEFLKNTLLKKIKDSNKNYWRNKYKPPINQLPILIMEHIRRKIEQFKMEYSAKNCTITIPFWAIEMIQSQLRYHGNIEMTLDFRVSVNKIVDWIIWNIRREKVMLGHEDEVELDEMPQWVIKFIAETISYKETTEIYTLERLLNWAIISRVEENKPEINPGWVLKPIFAKIRDVNDHALPQKFTEVTNNLPDWATRRMISSVEKQYGLQGLTETALENKIPHWFVEYIKIKILENGNETEVMQYAIKHSEIIEFSLWYTKKTTDKMHRITIRDIPSWALDYINTVIVSSGNDERAFNFEMPLFKIMDFAMWSEVKKNLMSLGIWSPMTPKGLPYWINQYLQNKIQQLQNGMGKRAYAVPRNQLTKEEIDKLLELTEIISEENFFEIQNIPEWVLEFLDSKIQEMNGGTSAFKVSMTVDEILDWFLWNTKRLLNKEQQLFLSSTPDWAQDLLFLQLEEDRYDFSVLQNRLTLENVLNWGIANTLTGERSKPPYKRSIPKLLGKLTKHKLMNVNINRLRNRFHKGLNTEPEWMTEWLRLRDEDLPRYYIFPRKNNHTPRHKYRISWGELPNWFKVLLSFKMEKMYNSMNIMYSEITFDELVDYSLWYNKESLGWTKHLHVKDIPKWAVILMELMLKGKEGHEEVFQGSYTLEDIYNFAVYMKFEKQVVEKDSIDWSEFGLYKWIITLLENMNADENSLPNDIPDWVVEIVKTDLKEYSDERMKYLIKDYILMKYLLRNRPLPTLSKFANLNIEKYIQNMGPYFKNLVEQYIPNESDAKLFFMDRKTTVFLIDGNLGNEEAYSLTGNNVRLYHEKKVHIIKKSKLLIKVVKILERGIKALKDKLKTGNAK